MEPARSTMPDVVLPTLATPVVAVVAAKSSGFAVTPTVYVPVAVAEVDRMAT